MFISSDYYMFNDVSGRFVQTRARRLEKGPTDLRLLWKDRIAASNNTNATDIQVRDGSIKQAEIMPACLPALLAPFSFLSPST